MHLLLVHSFLLLAAIGIAHASVTASVERYPTDDCYALHGIPKEMVYLSRAVLHVGSQSEYCNTLSLSNRSQVSDLRMNGGGEFTPGHSTYESGQPLIDSVDESSGASDHADGISIRGTAGVKYLSASSITRKWAGQTAFDSDGRIETLSCDQINGVCSAKASASGAALVHSNRALAESDQGSTIMFPTTAKTTTVNPAAPTASNGHRSIADASVRTSRGRRIDGTFELTHTLSSIDVLIAGASPIICMSVEW